jgi:phage baseplate assembly protein gpV
LGKDGQGIILGGVATKPQEKGVLTIKAEKIRLIGPVEQTGGDMTSDGISAQHHKHGGIVSGPAKTDEPE